MAILFTGDQHWGHDRIRSMANRPYASLEEMNEDLVQRWNAKVRPGDDVYHLGDMFYKCPPKLAKSIFRRLNGKIHLVIGNHDKASLIAELEWASPPQHYREVAVDGTRFVLFHYGMRVWSGMWRGSRHLYGHSHGKLPGTNRCCDVGVDADWTNSFPVTAPEIIAYQDTLPSPFDASWGEVKSIPEGNQP